MISRKEDVFVLGISCFYHDSAACLLQGGNIVAGAQEERFTVYFLQACVAKNIFTHTDCLGTRL